MHWSQRRCFCKLQAKSQCAHQLHCDGRVLGRQSLDPVYCWGVITEERNMRIFHVTYGFHYQPKHEQAGHFQVRISDQAIWVVIRDNTGRNVFWSLQSKNNWWDSLLLSNDDPAKSMSGCISNPNVVRPACHQISTLRWCADCLDQECATVAYCIV